MQNQEMKSHQTAYDVLHDLAYGTLAHYFKVRYTRDDGINEMTR